MEKVYIPYQNEAYMEGSGVYKDEMRLNPYDVESGRIWYNIKIINYSYWINNLNQLWLNLNNNFCDSGFN